MYSVFKSRKGLSMQGLIDVSDFVGCWARIARICVEFDGAAYMRVLPSQTYICMCIYTLNIIRIPLPSPCFGRQPVRASNPCEPCGTGH